MADVTLPLNDNAASTTVVATVGANGTLLGGDNTSVKSTTGPGTGIPLAFDLNGTDDAIDISAAAFSRTAGQEWTASAWVNKDGTGNYGIFGINGATTSRITFVGTTTIRVTGAGGTSVDFAFTFSTATWYNIVVTHTSGDVIRCYSNGVESATGALSLAQTFAPTRVGNQNTVFMDGRMAMAKLAGSLLDVAALYAEKDSATGIARLIGHGGLVGQSPLIGSGGGLIG